MSLFFCQRLVLQVHQFSNKQTEMALRVASLDYLGTVASRLRKDAVANKMDQKDIDRILREVGDTVIATYKGSLPCGS